MPVRSRIRKPARLPLETTRSSIKSQPPVMFALNSLIRTTAGTTNPENGAGSRARGAASPRAGDAWAGGPAPGVRRGSILGERRDARAGGLARIAADRLRAPLVRDRSHLRDREIHDVADIRRRSERRRIYLDQESGAGLRVLDRESREIAAEGRLHVRDGHAVDREIRRAVGGGARRGDPIRWRRWGRRRGR